MRDVATDGNGTVEWIAKIATETKENTTTAPTAAAESEH